MTKITPLLDLLTAGLLEKADHALRKAQENTSTFARDTWVAQMTASIVFAGLADITMEIRKELRKEPSHATEETTPAPDANPILRC